MPSSVGPVFAPGSLGSSPQPVVEWDGLVLRPWEVADAPAVHAAFQDPAMRLWHRRTAGSVDEVAGWTAQWRSTWAAETHAHWAVTEGGEVVGRASLRGLDLECGQGEVAYWTSPWARRRRVAVRTVGALVDWAFTIGFVRLELAHSTVNTASCGVAAAAGFAFEGVRLGAVPHADGWHDMHLHARLSPALDGKIVTPRDGDR